MGVELRDYVDKIQNIVGDRYKFPTFPIHGLVKLARKSC